MEPFSMETNYVSNHNRLTAQMKVTLTLTQYKLKRIFLSVYFILTERRYHLSVGRDFWKKTIFQFNSGVAMFAL